MDELANADDDVGKIFSGNTFEKNHCKIGNKHEVDKFAHQSPAAWRKSLTNAEKRALKAYRRVGSDDDNVADADKDQQIDGPIDATKMFDDKIKAQKTEKKRKGSRYINTDFCWRLLQL